MVKQTVLNMRQENFCIEYIKCDSIQQALINAGYSKGYAKSHYLDIMKNTLIKARIKELMADFNMKKIAEAEEVMAFLSSVMRGELQEELVVNERGKQIKVKKEVDMKDRIRCAELMAKKHKLLSDKVEITGEVTQQVVFIGGDELPEDNLIDEPIECSLLEDVIEVQYKEELEE